MDDQWKTVGALAARFDAHDRDRGMAHEESVTLQILKIGEEFGEAAQAVIGVKGTNPRKGDSHTWDDVEAEVADVIVTAMVALARMRPDAPAFFAEHLRMKSDRFL
ncbi:MazG-like family protein [Streptomyces sp. NPDC097981]|uniref:MazG-like family protein n=1 Tax=Streptomyces sp. NPDC097981 TaxID=3155428 RepID=UPI003320A284